MMMSSILRNPQKHGAVTCFVRFEPVGRDDLRNEKLPMKNFPDCDRFGRRCGGSNRISRDEDWSGSRACLSRDFLVA
ncbi:hypothetical protein PCANC_00290 [Puccinia coronata f. sp. avenae]|uniref:Uncharacterized protein n=1 Tax=Puccinia coronata f. sp. avenae TaxID=200324 RepID=A0A2N5W9F1_9BASI|nr:hypothetical protein PCANC_00290 [Puccinia coronata f. sp. avenae]